MVTYLSLGTTAASDARMVRAVAEEFDAITAGLTEEEKEAGCIDIRYKTAAGKHIIIELKRYKREVTLTELQTLNQQGIAALKKCLTTHRPDERDDVECIIILGSPPISPAADAEQVLRLYKARYILFDQLIEDTLRNYRDYLEKQHEASELSRLLDQITNEVVPVEDNSGNQNLSLKYCSSRI